MSQIGNLPKVEKYLKPVQVASYRAQDLAYPDKGWSIPLPASWQGRRNAYWNRFRLFFGEIVVAHILVAVFLLRSRLSQATIVLPKFVDRGILRKRAFHQTCALLGLILTLPFFFLISLAIKLDSTGPVFYRQIRVGVNRRRAERRNRPDSLLICRRGRDRRQKDLFGRPFMVFKFRTMVVDAEKRCGPIWATKNDPRCTKVGRFLRATRLDELPQLFNVLMGEMAIVGPRPERPHFVAQLAGTVEGYTRRLDVLPGITGLAQVERGYDGSIDDVRAKVNYDLRYIESASIKKDLLIMFRTIGVLIGCRGL